MKEFKVREQENIIVRNQSTGVTYRSSASDKSEVGISLGERPRGHWKEGWEDAAVGGSQCSEAVSSHKGEEKVPERMWGIRGQ